MPLPVTKHGNSVSVLQFLSVSSQTVATAFFRLQIYCASVDETRDMCVVDTIFFFHVLYVENSMTVLSYRLNVASDRVLL